MPTRILRDGILTSKAINALSEPAELLYRRLMSVVDDYGRFEADVDLIRAAAFPRQLERWPVKRVSSCLDELRQLAAGCGGLPPVVVYDVAGKMYLQVSNFGQRERSEKYPAPPPQLAAKCGEVPSSAETCGDAPSDARLVGVGVGVGVGVESGSAKPAQAPSPTQTPSKESPRGTRFDESMIEPEWYRYAEVEHRWPKARIDRELEKFSNHWTGKSGKDATKVKWLATWRNWVITGSEYKPEPEQAPALFTGASSGPKPPALNAFEDYALMLMRTQLMDESADLSPDIRAKVEQGRIKPEREAELWAMAKKAAA